MSSTRNIMDKNSMKSLVNKKISKTMKFMGEDIKMNKLTVAEVLEVQEVAKSLEKDDNAGLELIKKVIKIAVPESNELTDDDFKSLPMDELAKLSNEIMKFSGMSGEGK